MVLDEYLNHCPHTIIGEIYISGPGLAEGYWNRPDLTKEKFIDNPYNPGHIMYKTGDLARRNRQGVLEYLGRSDEQVKVGGVRVELGEIEAALNSHPDISEAVVKLQSTRPAQEIATNYCIKCGLPSNYPTATFDDHGVCNLCNSYEQYQRKTKDYFRTMYDLEQLLRGDSDGARSEYDCMVLYSGGKDSSYALARVARMGFRVLAYTLDNGYISAQAKENIRRVVDALEVDHIFGETPAMNEIFSDSLRRFANVCNGCFKTLYTLSTRVALEKNIPYIITGLSRGQFFETRLTEELFTNDKIDASTIDETILSLRKTYHRSEDAVSRLLDVSMFETDEVFEKVQFVDFYRYCDSSLDEMYAYLDENLPWVRPTDTGRSTNCLINDLGIYYHKKHKGFHNYAFPYSWDVRTGHKQRDEALEELNDAIDTREIEKIMAEIGFTEPEQPEFLVAFYQAEKEIDQKTLTEYLKDQLPVYLIPPAYQRLESLPLTENGKVDRAALHISEAEDDPEAFVAPASEVEVLIAGIWSEVLGLVQVSATAEFIALGGQSLTAIRIMARINETLYMNLPVSSIFEDMTIARQSQRIESIMTSQMED